MTHWRFRSRLRSSTGKMSCTQAPRWASCGRFQAQNWMRATGHDQPVATPLATGSYMRIAVAGGLIQLLPQWIGYRTLAGNSP